MNPLARRLRSILVLLGLLACWQVTAGIFTAAAAERPSVVLVLCDDIRWDALSCAGHPHVETPHIGLKENPMPLDEGIGQALPDEAIR